MISLNKNKDFLKMYKRARSVVHPLVVVYCMKNRLGYSRLGITTSKKIGNAVQRNRARRVLREALRKVEPNMKIGYDIVLVARFKTTLCKSTQLEPVLRESLTQMMGIQN